jgi:thiosulfate/3-mercaptopyruvate sulfurtransferase
VLATVLTLARTFSLSLGAWWEATAQAHGHLPGAIHLDWYRDLSWTDARGVRNLLLPPEPFAAVMEAVGIGDQTRVVAYAETDHSGAARLWWALRFYGHDQVAVLNGGWTKWVVEGGL